ncbi:MULTISPECIES: DUF6527 family protein [unclassified Dehalobacter]|uniref:DUF6527 family protein n=1 Tax=unclassified Dehalobacter TaxID=2635733 RepID=UPI0010491547|nr:MULTISPECIES: DUF6527 family protein [unclassified Dehalobacter]TCX51914.1 ammonia monooxygenase [Dehalobacter sp. 14DCB1]TCX52974.1 ammonia monooxygenase [Dehalobacter sp. 12DCB1]
MKAALRRRTEGDREIPVVYIWCPGCEEYHAMPTEGPHKWDFNGEQEKPTLRPSILVRSGHYIPEHKGDCWCTYSERNQGEPAPFKCTVCHSFVTDGKIQFLSDSTHKLSGQTVDLPEIDL